MGGGLALRRSTQLIVTIIEMRGSRPYQKGHAWQNTNHVVFNDHGKTNLRSPYPLAILQDLPQDTENIRSINTLTKATTVPYDHAKQE